MSRINEKEGTAFDYFNDLRFFENDEDRIWYMNSLNKEEKAKLHGTYEAFYRTVWETYEHDVDAIERFFVKTIKRCNSQAILEDFYKWKKESKTGRTFRDGFPPMVSYGYMIRNPFP